jgi:lysyl-tRNA synthetase class I
VSFKDIDQNKYLTLEKNKEVLDHILQDVRDDLKAILMITAEQEVDKAIEKVMKRVDLKVADYFNPLYDAKFINLNWAFKKEE